MFGLLSNYLNSFFGKMFKDHVTESVCGYIEAQRVKIYEARPDVWQFIMTSVNHFPKINVLLLQIDMYVERQNVKSIKTQWGKTKIYGLINFDSSTNTAKFISCVPKQTLKNMPCKIQFNKYFHRINYACQLNFFFLHKGKLITEV